MALARVWAEGSCFLQILETPSLRASFGGSELSLSWGHQGLKLGGKVRQMASQSRDHLKPTPVSVSEHEVRVTCREAGALAGMCGQMRTPLKQELQVMEDF